MFFGKKYRHIYRYLKRKSLFALLLVFGSELRSRSRPFWPTFCTYLQNLNFTLCFFFTSGKCYRYVIYFHKKGKLINELFLYYTLAVAANRGAVRLGIL